MAQNRNFVSGADSTINTRSILAYVFTPLYVKGTVVRPIHGTSTHILIALSKTIVHIMDIVADAQGLSEEHKKVFLAD